MEFYSRETLEEMRRILRWQLLGGEISGFEFNRKSAKIDEIERKQRTRAILKHAQADAEKKAEKRVVTEASKEAMRWQVRLEKPSTAHRMDIQKPPRE